MYKKYERALKAEFGLDFQAYVNVVRANGNESGIYPDVGLLLSRLVADDHTDLVVEFGSGMSTHVLANACGRCNKELITAEHHPKWYGITDTCLRKLGLRDNLTFVCTESDESKFPNIRREASFAWVDGIVSANMKLAYGRLGACEYYWDYLKNSLLLFDDAQWNIDSWTEWLRRMGRSEETEFMFNPTGREDRHILVSLPAKDHYYTEVIKGCEL